MITIFEELSMNAWPALQTKLYDGWVMRFAEGYTKRANSINPIYCSTISLTKKLDYCEKEYEHLKLPVVYKLTPDSQPDIDQELDMRGYSRMDDTSVRTLQLNSYDQEIVNVNIDTEFNDAWVYGLFKCSRIINMKDRITLKRILSNITNDVICVNIQVDETIVACGFGVVERGFIGIFDIVVEESYRGNGYGKKLMHSILSSAVEKGVKTAYLQVVVGNVPAENLYESLGFREEYKYWYRVKN